MANSREYGEFSLMTIYLATDHAGFALKEKIKNSLKDGGYQVEDLGNFQYDESDDYDHDGLSNTEEAYWNTDPFNSDTDEDGFSENIIEY